MTLGLLFWLLFVLFVAFSAWTRRTAWPDWAPVAVLLFVLGWGVFGFVVKG